MDGGLAYNTVESRKLKVFGSRVFFSIKQKFWALKDTSQLLKYIMKRSYSLIQCVPNLNQISKFFEKSKFEFSRFYRITETFSSHKKIHRLSPLLDLYY